MRAGCDYRLPYGRQHRDRRDFGAAGAAFEARAEEIEGWRQILTHISLLLSPARAIEIKLVGAHVVEASDATADASAT
jgi:hypothetical protein